ncbi:aminotransferase [Leucosporidium creatinivorum]|uniref:Aminotransferase n=1 Tax=Leucosporidium creatinivorum TaxID=106004 RepID=A0A1Y2G0N4_9BASI|nr:aminotransferase [Leucosporidium creatinivorum]
MSAPLSKKWEHLASDQPEPQTEEQSKAHRLFREQDPAHQPRGSSTSNDKDSDDAPQVHGIVSPGSTGVMYVSQRAAANGWEPDHPEWANFGQGAPEVGNIPGASERPTVIDLAAMGTGINEYAPTTGVTALREAVANLYNETYRQGKESKYTKDNVCIVPGGRAGLTRVASVIGDVYVGYQIPEYTAYSEMLSSFRRLVPIPSALDAEDNYHMNITKLRSQIHEQGLSVVVASNPRNPTGRVVAGQDLQDLVKIAEEDGTTVVLDEFYSMYLYDSEARGGKPEGSSVSAAEFIEDVETTPVVIIDGLTKNWRLPGWRCCWVVGPRALVKALGQTGGSLDGGASHPLQVAAIPLLSPSLVAQDRLALQRHFKSKRDHVLQRLKDMGLEVHNKPNSTFYIWLDLSQLPAPLSSGLVFFEELLKEKVIVTPGAFFDLNPSHRRNMFASPCHHFIRLSYGPPLAELNRGLDGIQRLLEKASQAVKSGTDIFEVVGKDLKEHIE